MDHKSDTTNRNDDFHKSHVNHHHRLWMHGQEPEEKHCELSTFLFIEVGNESGKKRTCTIIVDLLSFMHDQ